MPIVRIDITGPKSLGYKRALLRGVREAVVAAAVAPDDRVNLRIIEVPADQVDLPSCRTKHYTVVEVLMLAGRSDEQKGALVAGVRERLAAEPGIKPSEIIVSFREASPADLDVLPGEGA